MRDIPEMDEYRRALESGRREHNNRQNSDVSNSLDKYSRESEIPMLFVMDNGVGLDARKMGAILGDGKSDKGNESGSTGSFGNGHLTAFALSHLRYVLYGGIAQNGEKIIFAGHAILASHKGTVEDGEDGRNRSKDGYYVRKIRDDELNFARFDFGDESDLPKFLTPKMEEIKREWGHGALIAVAAFNNFGDDRKGVGKDVARTVIREAALNFFAAIAERKLEVEVYESNELTEKLDHANLRAVLESHKNNMRGKHGFPSGARAWHFYETMMHGDRHVLHTELGDVELRLRTDVDAKRIAICRNKMWITEKPPNLKEADFADRANFSALLLVDSGDAGEAHHLIKLAETPLHNEIKPVQIQSPQDKRNVRRILHDLQSQIRNLVDERSEESFSPPDIMQVEQSDSVKGAAQRPQGEIKPINPRPKPPRPNSPNKPPRPKPPKSRPRSGRFVNAKVSTRRIRPGELNAVFESGQDCDCVELRLSLDGGADATCNGEPAGAIALGDVSVNGDILPDDCKLEDVNGKVYAALLGKWESGKRYNVRIGYDEPLGLGNHVLMFDLIRRKGKTSVQPNKEEESHA